MDLAKVRDNEEVDVDDHNHDHNIDHEQSSDDVGEDGNSEDGNSEDGNSEDGNSEDDGVCLPYLTHTVIFKC